MRFLKLWRWYGVWLLVCAGSSFSAVAHDIQKNQLWLQKQGPRCLHMKFALAPIDSLYAMTASGMEVSAFFEQYANFSETEFSKQVQKIADALHANTLMIGNDGVALHFERWVAPQPVVWQQTIREQRILYLANASNQGHALPVWFECDVCGPGVSGRIQLSVDQRLYPLQVIINEQDQFWLTPEIPSATADF